jgi:ABC-type transport system involved in multi-copper enzyme maturation permease subunit
VTPVIVLARLTFHEARRSKILLAALLLSVLFLTIYGLGINYIQADLQESSIRGGPVSVITQSEIHNFLMMAGLYVVNFLTVMMAVLTSVGTLSGEISSGTIHTLVSKPVRRWEIVLGKWFGYVILLSLYLGLLAGGVLFLIWRVAGYTAVNYLAGLFFLWLNAMLMLSVSFLGGAALSTLTNGVLVFGLFGIAFVGGWIEQIGSFIENQTAVNIGVISSLIMPSEALWKRLAFEMQSPLASTLGGVTPFSSATVPSDAMIVYAVIYTSAALFLAIRIFSGRDL